MNKSVLQYRVTKTMLMYMFGQKTSGEKKTSQRLSIKAIEQQYSDITSVNFLNMGLLQTRFLFCATLLLT